MSRLEYLGSPSPHTGDYMYNILLCHSYSLNFSRLKILCQHMAIKSGKILILIFRIYCTCTCTLEIIGDLQSNYMYYTVGRILIASIY